MLSTSIPSPYASLVLPPHPLAYASSSGSSRTSGGRLFYGRLVCDGKERGATNLEPKDIHQLLQVFLYTAYALHDNPTHCIHCLGNPSLTQDCLDPIGVRLLPVNHCLPYLVAGISLAGREFVGLDRKLEEAIQLLIAGGWHLFALSHKEMNWERRDLLQGKACFLMRSARRPIGSPSWCSW